eukprot:TRINITY_DN12300_c0_g1_i1.p1 TRINITY_DN12300_c0_g1~~TRINITY_DN12300_c0_g1_i1.p1  ORF type:complete len:464 (-),score=137.53 TRINITY_DN12300_c0_g1_i1:82-1341(-)
MCGFPPKELVDDEKTLEELGVRNSDKISVHEVKKQENIEVKNNEVKDNNHNSNNNFLDDFKVLVSAHPQSDNQFEEFWMEVNPIFEMKVLLHQICSKLSISKEKARFRDENIDLNRSPMDNKIKNGQKIVIEINKNGFPNKKIKTDDSLNFNDDNRGNFNNGNNMGGNNFFDPNMLNNILSNINVRPNQQNYNNSFGGGNQDQLELALSLSKQENEQNRETEENVELFLVSLGMKINRMKDDGNCLFRAISDQLYKNPNQHERLREEITDYMKEKRHHYTNFIHEDFDWYINNMKQSTVYATNVEIQGFSEKENCKVIIYSDQNIGEAPIEINPYETEPKQTIYLSYHRGNHYNSVIPVDDYSHQNETVEGGQVNNSGSNSSNLTSSNKVECPYCGSMFGDVETAETHMITDCPVMKGF